MRAAVNPEPGTDLYFVAKGDGYHAFASTLEEHNANVREYQLGRKKLPFHAKGRQLDDGSYRQSAFYYG